MKPFFQSKPQPLPSAHGFTTLFNVEIPVPALQRGWLHGREFTQPWQVERIAARIGDACWFSHYARDNRDDHPGSTAFELQSIAGFWPDGGFLELQMQRGNLLDELPRGTLGIYSDSPARTEAIMADLLAHYAHDLSAIERQPRIGLLNFAYGRLTVERIPVTAQQTVARERLDLYYGSGMTAWTDAWLETLNARRYGPHWRSRHRQDHAAALARSLARGHACVLFHARRAIRRRRVRRDRHLLGKREPQL